MATDVEIANQALTRVGAESITSGEWTTPTNERSRVVKNSWPFVRRAVLRERSWNVVTIRANLYLPSLSALTPEWDFASVYALPTSCLRILEVNTTEQWRVERAPTAAVAVGGTVNGSYPLVSANVVTVLTGSSHGLATGDFVYLTLPNQVSLRDDIQPIVVTGTTTFTMPEVDPTGFTAGSASSATAKVTMAPAIVTDATGSLGVRYIEDRTDPSDFDAMLTEALVLRMAGEIVERVTDSTTKRELLLAEYANYMMDVKHIEGQEQSPSDFEEDTWITSRY